MFCYLLAGIVAVVPVTAVTAAIVTARRLESVAGHISSAGRPESEAEVAVGLLVAAAVSCCSYLLSSIQASLWDDRLLLCSVPKKIV